MAVKMKGLEFLEKSYQYLKLNYGPGFEETLIAGDIFREALIHLGRQEDGIRLASELQQVSNEENRKRGIAVILIGLEEYSLSIQFLVNYNF